MSVEKTTLGNLLGFLLAISFTLFLVEYLVTNQLMAATGDNMLYQVMFFFETLMENPFHLRAVYFMLLLMFAYNTPSLKLGRNVRQQDRKYWWMYALLTSAVFFAGYLRQVPLYNAYVYPAFFFSNIYLTAKAVSLVRKNFNEEDIFGLSQETGDFSIKIETTGALPLWIRSPQRGIYINGNPGSGKSASLIKPILYYCAYHGRAGFVYDFEGDPREKEAPVLSRVCYTGIVNGKNETGEGHKTKFAFLNFTDLSKTVRCNPFSPKYLKSRLDVSSVCNILMKNLEPAWREKTDFWASNAIAYITGITYMLLKHHPDKISLPLVVSVSLHDHNAVLDWLCSDSEVEKMIIPIATAKRQNAEGQIAGATSSAQLPTTRLLDENIFWVLGKDEFNLDITNPADPHLFCVGMAPSLKPALGPAISVIAAVCMNQMNQFGTGLAKKVKSIFCVDEFPSVILNDIDYFIATARKKDVATILALQDQMQANFNYGEKPANIIRTSLGSHFYGATGDFKTAKEVSDMLGKIKKSRTSYTESSESSLSTSESQEKDEVLQARDIMSQPPGHFTGFIAGGRPPYFHSQISLFHIEEYDIPPFSLPDISIDVSNLPADVARKMNDAKMQDQVKQNFEAILEDARDILMPYIMANM
jgi:hypothetical protein